MALVYFSNYTYLKKFTTNLTIHLKRVKIHIYIYFFFIYINAINRRND